MFKAIQFYTEKRKYYAIDLDTIRKAFYKKGLW